MHATCVVVGESGVLLLGASGSGKSTLARLLIEGERRRGGFARLVADDAVAVAAVNGRLVARPKPGIAGLHELRGFGLEPTVHEPAVVVRLVVELGKAGERMPAPAELVTVVAGVGVPRIQARNPDVALRLAEAMLSTDGPECPAARGLSRGTGIG